METPSIGSIGRVVSVADILPFFRRENTRTISRGTAATVFRGSVCSLNCGPTAVGVEGALIP